MKEIPYKRFSFQTHQKNWSLMRPNVCQFELTFRCGLRCRHCYTDCYNTSAAIKKELDTREVKLILDKVYHAGILWLCLTGGDPLTRDDFLDIYRYAKDKGFLITIFTNGCSMTKDVAAYLRQHPPFVIEMTLNGVTKEAYEKISQATGSFDKAIRGLELMRKAQIPLKIKTQVTKDNIDELPKIKKFIQGHGLKFRPNTDLFARLNGDQAPCRLRLSIEDVLRVEGKEGAADEACSFKTKDLEGHAESHKKGKSLLFQCAAGGGDGINVDPYGNMFLCELIRRPAFNLLKGDIMAAWTKLAPLARHKVFSTDSRCAHCEIREFCRLCPGRAFLETGNIEAPVDYHCKLASALAKSGCSS